MAEIAVTISEPSIEVRAQVDDRVVLRFDENPTTGFVWRMVGAIPSNLAPSHSDFRPAGSAPGAGAKREFAYVCQSRGTGELRFTLARPWQPDSPLKTSLVRVQCQ
jgi:predicted secreted protein